MTPDPRPVRDLTSRGMPFRVRSSGRAAGDDPPTYVLVHGIGTSHRYLTRLHHQLAGAADVHSIDLVGFGGLPKSTEAPSVHEMAGALGGVLDRVGVTGAVLVGHSMGSQWVVELAVLRPDLARAVVVIGPVTDDRRRSVVAQSLALWRDILGEPLRTNAMVFVDYLRCGPIWFTRNLRHMLRYRIERRVALLDVPLLVLRGGNDPIATLEWCRRLRRRARQAVVVIVPGHRHNAQHTAPHAVASALTSFVQRAC